MCFLTNKVPKKFIEGYKIVAEKEGKNYSLAMGFCYENYPDGMPVLKYGEQNSLSYEYSEFILDEDSNTGFSKEMKGRTAIFINKNDAIAEAENHIPSIYFNAHLIDMEYVVKVKKARVSVDLMEGLYGYMPIKPVVAGRKIEFLEEVKFNER